MAQSVKQFHVSVLDTQRRPVAGATVQITGQTEIEITATDGEATFRDLKPGEYKFSVSKTGFEAIQDRPVTYKPSTRSS